MTLPNLTSLKLILTVREKLPNFPLDGLATQTGEQAKLIRMIGIAAAYPFVMIASDTSDQIQHMKSTDIPKISYVCIGCDWNLGDEKPLLDNVVNDFIANMPVDNAKYHGLDQVPLNGIIPALPSFSA